MGIPETSNEDTDKITIAIAKKIGAETDIDHIDRSHRVGFFFFLKEGGARPIIVKFTSYRAKAELISNRRKLATVSADKLFPSLNWPLRPAGWNKDRPFVHRVFINDDPTKARAAAAGRERSLKKAGKIKDVWLRKDVWYVSNVMTTRSWASPTSRILVCSMPNQWISEPFKDAIVKGAVVPI